MIYTKTVNKYKSFEDFENFAFGRMSGIQIQVSSFMRIPRKIASLVVVKGENSKLYYFTNTGFRGNIQFYKRIDCDFVKSGPRMKYFIYYKHFCNRVEDEHRKRWYEIAEAMMNLSKEEACLMEIMYKLEGK